MTPSAALLWVVAALLAGALAFWDFATSDQSTAASSPSPPGSDDVELEVVYEPTDPSRR